MTNKERLISLLGFEPPKNAAEAAMIDAGITEAATYTAPALVSVKTAAIEVMKVILTTADTTNSLTGFSQKYDRDAIRKRISELEEELLITIGPSIKDATYKW